MKKIPTMIRFVIFVLCLITINGISKASSTAIQNSDHNQDEECAYPEHAITVDKNEYPQKAWNKCIELADAVFPCKNSSNPSIKKVRIDTCNVLSTPLIVTDPEEVMPHEFPHMAALGYVDEQENKISWDCGGSLISNQWVMAPAHCVYHRGLQSEVSKVKLGEIDLSVADDHQSLFNVIEIVKHPDFKPPKIYNDIALIKMDRPVTFSEKIRPACLHVGNAVIDNKAFATGFGRTYDQSHFKNDKLTKKVLNKLSKEECSSKFPPMRKFPNGLEDTQICYNNINNDKDTCQRNSDGPLQIHNYGVYCTYTVIGISSVGKTCGSSGFPEIYTKVSAFVPWIESVVWPN